MLSVEKDLSAKMANTSFVCAVLVVSMHVGKPLPIGTFPWYFIEFLHEIVGRMAVPFFFMASGFFLAGHMEESGWYSREMTKRFWTLLMPYVLWSVLFAVYLVPVAVLANIHAHRTWNWNIAFPGWGKILGLDFLQNPFLPPLWFLRWLMCLCVASPLLYWLVRKTGTWGLAFVYVFAVLKSAGIPGFHPVSWWYPWKWVLHPGGLFYFLLGISWRMGLFQEIAHWVKLLAVWVGMVYFVAKCVSYSAVGVGCTDLASAFGSFYARDIVCLNPCLLALVWKTMPHGKWPSWLTGASFALYISHPFFTHFLDSIRLFSRLNLEPGDMCMLRFAFALTGGVVCPIVTKKMFPGVAKILLGGR